MEGKSLRDLLEAIKWWFGVIFTITMVVFGLPYALWVTSRDNDNLDKRGKDVLARITKIEGKRIGLEYPVKDTMYESEITYSNGSFYKIRTNQYIQIRYDTVDPENVVILSEDTH